MGANEKSDFPLILVSSTSNIEKYENKRKSSSKSF